MRDRKRRNDGNFYIYWTDSEFGSREKSIGTPDPIHAEKLFELWVRENRGEQVPRLSRDVTVEDVLEHYAVIQRPKVSAPDRIDYAIKALRSYWKGKPVSAVNRLSCAKYEAFRREAYQQLWPNRDSLSPNTIRRELAVLAAALNVAKDDNLIDREVTVFRPLEVPSDVEYFTCDEALDLLRLSWCVRRARSHLRLFLLIGFLTGRRKEAILSLKWRDIDFTTGVITWNPEGRQVTKKVRPPGAIPKRLRKHLLRRRRHYPNDEFVISVKGQGISDIKTSFHTLARTYRIERRAKLVAGGMALSEANLLAILPKAHPHMMRHSCATWLMQKGVKVADACSFLGMTEDTLRRRYWHHHPDYQREAADAF